MLRPDLQQLIIPRYGQRVAALGNSGEGKTQLLRELFLGVEDGIFVDTKHDEDNADLGRVVTGDKIYSAEHGRYVWKTPKEFVFDADAKEKFFGWALEAGHRVILVDEYGDICESAQQYPRNLRLCIMRGRSRELSIWGTTQEPLRVPSFLFGQAQHFYCFYLGHPDHRKAAEKYMEGVKIPWEAMPSAIDVGNNSKLAHRFVYRGPGGIYGPTKLML